MYSYCYTTYQSPIGTLTLAGDDSHLAGLWIEGQKYFGGSLTQPMTAADPHRLPAPLASACGWLDRYFSGAKPLPSELPLAPAGSDFRQLVWKILCEIPYGEVSLPVEINVCHTIVPLSTHYIKKSLIYY